MNKLRAQEIAASPVMAHVTFNGEAVYIQHVEEEGNAARIYPMNAPEKEQLVNLDMLKEE